MLDSKVREVWRYIAAVEFLEQTWIIPPFMPRCNWWDTTIFSWKRTNVACFVEFFEVQKFNFGPQCDSLARESPQNPLNSGLGWFRNFSNFPRLCWLCSFPRLCRVFHDISSSTLARSIPFSFQMWTCLTYGWALARTCPKVATCWRVTDSSW